MKLFCLLMAYLPSWGYGANEPWDDGEEITYQIYWGMVHAADARFHAQREEKNWRLRLQLESRGMVEALHPIRSQFQSLQNTAPWRSVEFSYDRNEGTRQRKELIRMDYANDLITRINQDSENSNSALLSDSVDDLLSMLYTLRRIDWRTQDKVSFRVVERDTVRVGEVRKIRHQADGITGYREVPLFELHALEHREEGDKKRPLEAKIWITDDAVKIPVRAEVRMKFGTVLVRRKL